MAKVKRAYFCRNCGAQSPKWVGKCSSCGEWDTYQEEILESNTAKSSGGYQSSKTHQRPQALEEVESSNLKRVVIKDTELSRVLGGGIVPGSIVLFGGEPGIGKSTLMLQIALQENNLKVLYVSGEESSEQIKMRADRIDAANPNCFVLNETSTTLLFQHCNELEPDLLIIDSIQTIHTPKLESAPGSISQIRECTAEIMRMAKDKGIPVFLIGHITKEGSLAGPKVLEHMVDTVLQFEGDRNHVYRLLRSVKNRFGNTNELGIYEMSGDGLRAVDNPSELLISNNDQGLSGTAIGATMEGLRPLLIEVQALVSSAAYGTPQRSSTGFDLRRLNMLLAVLEKRCGFRLGSKDVFLNIAGGIRVDDPAIDLAVVSAIMSSNADIAVDTSVCLAGEVGLSGEIRPVTRVAQRISEAEKLGYKQIIISKHNKAVKAQDFKITVHMVCKIEECIKLMFG